MVRVIFFGEPSQLIRHSGNIHINVVAAAYTPEIAAALEPFVFELVGGCRQTYRKANEY